MMNQGEIDAGPPNKKPKIGGGGGAPILTSSTNPLQTQISESNGKSITV